MSEFQYYEFRAIDRPLSQREIGKLRSLSTRAEITPTSFQNTYSYGDFRGNPITLMEKYFDTFVYTANWGTREFMLRFPKSRINMKTVSRYCGGDHAWAKVKGKFLILGFMADDEPGEWDGWMESEEWLPALMPLREALASGDLRCLYLGYLLRIQNGEVGEKEKQPPTPRGMDKLTPSLKAFVDFLGIDRNLLVKREGKSFGQRP